MGVGGKVPAFPVDEVGPWWAGQGYVAYAMGSHDFTVELESYYMTKRIGGEVRTWRWLTVPREAWLAMQKVRLPMAYTAPRRLGKATDVDGEDAQ